MPVDSVERFDLVAETSNRAPGLRLSASADVQQQRRSYGQLRWSENVNTDVDFLVCRSYAEEAAANRQYLGMSSCAGDAGGCHRFFVRGTELSPAFGDTDM
jgi:hypothetical protein